MLATANPGCSLMLRNPGNDPSSDDGTDFPGKMPEHTPKNGMKPDNMNKGKLVDPQEGPYKPPPKAGGMMFSRAYMALTLAGTSLGAYHGYKRNQSVGWAIGWAFLGGLAPFIAIPVAFAQGLGQPKGS